jgi:hypothetical protein
MKTLSTSMVAGLFGLFAAFAAFPGVARADSTTTPAGALVAASNGAAQPGVPLAALHGEHTACAAKANGTAQSAK